MSAQSQPARPSASATPTTPRVARTSARTTSESKQCAKVRYRSRTAAVLALRAIAKKAAPDRKVPRGAYLCRECGHWHLTSASGVQVPPWSRRRA